MSKVYALKEWAAICAALDKGLQTITLRKGGIEEEEGQFIPRYREFLLYPTLEHQKSTAIKPQQLNLFKSFEPIPEKQRQIVYHLWATCERVLPVISKDIAQALTAFTVWTPEAILHRFDLYPDKPLLLLLLRVHS